MIYDPDKAVERKIPEAGTVVEAVITIIREGKIKDFVTGDALKKFENPDQDTIHVTSEGKFDGRIHKCETLFTFDIINDKVEYNTKSSMAYFKEQYKVLPKVGLMVKHIATPKGYFKLLLKV